MLALLQVKSVGNMGDYLIESCMLCLQIYLIMCALVDEKIHLNLLTLPRSLLFLEPIALGVPLL